MRNLYTCFSTGYDMCTRAWREVEVGYVYSRLFGGGGRGGEPHSWYARNPSTAFISENDGVTKYELSRAWNKPSVQKVTFNNHFDLFFSRIGAHGPHVPHPTLDPFWSKSIEMYLSWVQHSLTCGGDVSCLSALSLTWSPTATANTWTPAARAAAASNSSWALLTMSRQSVSSKATFRAPPRSPFRAESRAPNRAELHIISEAVADLHG